MRRPSVCRGNGVKHSVKMGTRMGKKDIRAAKYRVGRKQRQDIN
jgi:hypothetical protein